MSQSSKWVDLDVKMPEDESICQNSDAQNWEKNRRIKSEAGAKNPRKYIQDIVGFLWQEAKTAEESLAFQIKEEDRYSTVRVTLGSETTSEQGRTPKAAKDAAASAMLQKIGPYIEDSVYLGHISSISAALPQELRSWLPPVFDARHVAVPDGGMALNYEAEVTLGPLAAVSVTDNMETSLSSVVKHLLSFLKTRNLVKLASEPLEEDIEEMDVSPNLSQPYVQTTGLIDVRLEAHQEDLNMIGGCKDQLLPPVDVYVMQENLPEGKFPPYYGNVDPWGYCKVFYCYRCMCRLNGLDMLIKHVKGVKHWRKIGKFFLKGQLVETFNPVKDPFVPDGSEIGPETDEEKQDRLGSIPVLCRNCEDDGKTEIASGKCLECNEHLCKECELAHGKTRITKTHKIETIPPPLFKHPLKDKESGVKVEKDNIKYLISVYRCSTGHPSKARQSKSLSPKAFPPPAQSTFPPPSQGAYQGNEEPESFASIGYVNPVESMGNEYWGPRMGGGPSMGYNNYNMGGGQGFYGQRFGQMNSPMFRGGFGQQRMGFNDFNPRKSWGSGTRGGGGGSNRRHPPSTAQGSNEEGNVAYSGKLGKRSITSKKMKPKFSALPPPGHEQWNNISGNENFDNPEQEEDFILPGIDNTRAHIPGAGQGFKADKTGAKVCINWRRGFCNFGDRCIYLHYEKGQVQAALDATVPYNERDMVGYRTRPGAQKGQDGGGLVAGKDGAMVPAPEKPPTLDDTSDWFNDSGSSAVSLKVVDREAICRSIQTAKKATESFETDFTNVPKKSLRMDTEEKKKSRFND